MIDAPQINRRTPGQLKTFRAGQRCEIVSRFAALPRGTEGTVVPVGHDGLMLWFTSGGRCVLVQNYDVDEVRPPEPLDMVDFASLVCLGPGGSQP